MAFDKPAAEALAELINKANGVGYTAATLGHGDPEPYVEVDARRDTTLLVWHTSKPDRKFRVNYNRLPLPDLIPSGERTFPYVNTYDHVSDLLPLINSTFELALTVEDIVDDPISGAGSVIFKANAKSLVLRGQVPLTLSGA